MALDKQYNPHDHESDIYQRWEGAGVFKPNGGEPFDANERPPYVIMLPPPNITGNLHMGHALQDTIMDILARYHRMLGEPVLWLPGTDSAAIATNKVISEQLAEEGLTRHDIGREEFLKRTEDWYEKTGAEILNQMKRLGCSCDWSRNRFSMDEQYLESANEEFVRYYEKGYIYRGARIVNWDPASQTTVSDLEIEYQAEQAPFYYFQYGPFEIGTARPETKFSDKYVVIHPDDERYTDYKHGQELEVEWINGPITATVIKDEASDPNVGSGVMTITPWHSAIDFELAQKHGFDMEQIIDFEGKLLPVAGEFAGLTIEEARPKIVERLEQKGLVTRIDENYEHNIALNDRGKGVIEPQVMRQWFVDMSKLRDETIQAAAEDVVRFVPPRWKKHFITWMENVYDWNINRQIWLGHRLPVWWKPGTHGTDDEEGNFVVSTEKPEGEWEQDPDVLDTWFPIALWPFATLGWPKNTEDLQAFYPSSVLVTARDILYLWVARMIFSGLDLMQGEEYGNRSLAERIPFRDVFIHPTVLAKDGRRMSKSLGTGIDPLELIEEHGADATRFGLMSQMSYDNQAIKFDEADVTAGRNFANKIWNIARLLETLPQSSSENPLPAPDPSASATPSVQFGDVSSDMSSHRTVGSHEPDKSVHEKDSRMSSRRDEGTVADDWIEGRQAYVQAEVGELINQYKIGEAARLLYDFVWHDFADWYLEILKVEGSTVRAQAAFDKTLVMLHPFLPFITEALWQERGVTDGLLITAQWESSEAQVNEEADTALEQFKSVVTGVRGLRRLLSIPPREVIPLYLEHAVLPQPLETVAKVQLQDEMPATTFSFPLADGTVLQLSDETVTKDRLANALEGLEAEQANLSQQIERSEQALTTMRGHAPDDVVQEREASLEELKAQAGRIQESLDLLHTYEK